MIRRPPRSTRKESSAASDVYKRQSLNQATIPFVVNLANNGLKKALSSDQNFLNGLNVMAGNCTQKDVARDLELEFLEPEKLIA